MSVFDFFAMLIPGLAWILVFSLKWDTLGCVGYDNVHMSICLAILAVFAYVVGLINNMVMDWLWKPFRNNPLHIGLYYYKAILTRKCPQEACAPYFLSLFLFLICMVIAIVIYPPCLSIIFAIMLLSCRIAYVCCHCSKKRHKCKCICCRLPLTKHYLDDYEKLDSKGRLGAAPIIEGQIAFLRNLLPPLIIGAAMVNDQVSKLLGSAVPSCFSENLLSVLTILVFITILSRQGKVYEIVKETARTVK